MTLLRGGGGGCRKWRADFTRACADAHVLVAYHPSHLHHRAAAFDVNKPGEEARTLRGGVAGGSILQGVLKKGDEVEVRPGIISRDAEGRVRCTPILSRVVSLLAEKNDLEYAVPGGLIGVGTKMDPTLTRADRLVGQVLGHAGTLPDVFSEIEVRYTGSRGLIGYAGSVWRALGTHHVAATATLYPAHFACAAGELLPAQAPTGRQDGGRLQGRQGAQPHQGRDPHGQHRLHLHRRQGERRGGARGRARL